MSLRCDYTQFGLRQTSFAGSLARIFPDCVPLGPWAAVAVRTKLTTGPRFRKTLSLGFPGRQLPYSGRAHATSRLIENDRFRIVCSSTVVTSIMLVMHVGKEPVYR